MHFHILTLFPDMVRGGLNTSIIGRACEKELLSIEAVNIRDYTEDKHNKVDDYPYGGGAGMLMQAQPVYDAYQAVKERIALRRAAQISGDQENADCNYTDQNRRDQNCIVQSRIDQNNVDQNRTDQGRPLRVVYVTPQGKVFDQSMARELAKEEDLVLLCGHYEGIDERVLEEIVTDYVSIGDYVLTGGELPAMVMIDAISRMVPGVLKNEESGEFESFHENLLEYPQYTRPEVWRGKKVPDVLLSGDHAKVDKWRLERSIERTKERRPDLYEKYDLPGRALSYLKKDKLFHMDMIELIRHNQAEAIYLLPDGVMIRDSVSKAWLITAENKDAGERLLSCVKDNAGVFCCHQRFVAESVRDRFGKTFLTECYQLVYTKKTPFDCPEGETGVTLRPMDESYADEVFSHYNVLHTRDEIQRFLQKGFLCGAFLMEEGQEKLAGFIGLHEEGAMGMLEVFEPYRRKGIAQALEKFQINRMLEKGRTPYGQVFSDNEASLKLQEKMGFKRCPKKIYWIS